MPRGRKGEKRPGDVIGNAVKVMRIAMGAGRFSPLGPVGVLETFSSNRTLLQPKPHGLL
jgi:hypothetical protein